MYYIISLKHTRKTDEFITLWGRDNKGYFWVKSEAGIYEVPEEGYHNTESSFPVKKEEADKLFIEVPYCGKNILAIPNNNESVKKLGLKWKRGQLERQIDENIIQNN
ncbi:hypothetical protein MYP_676 [Sporocytophaga myxococcoides]|uniref:Uncharacterized protein n=1 Tax=Sporocytophaga myxococcoides TaxID=153721 RepID=A0A098LAI3_9BACT|nr:hypothetical protein [Sporocytophaga myxococcoides]GAL83449.1 hypothetical protein MYP_676 [Sporocytophaga myxococcoides]